MGFNQQRMVGYTHVDDECFHPDGLGFVARVGFKQTATEHHAWRNVLFVQACSNPQAVAGIVQVGQAANDFKTPVQPTAQHHNCIDLRGQGSV